MKKLMSLLLAVVMVCASLVGFVGCGDDFDEEIVIYNWAEYMYPGFEGDFYEYYLAKTGKKLKITYVTFDTNETMLTKVLNNDAQVDVICPSEYAIERLIDGGYLDKLDEAAPEVTMDNLDNVSEIYQKIAASFGDATLCDYMVPYMWGTLGILYNTAYVSAEQAEEAGWGLLWNKTNIEAINGKIYMKDSIRDSYAVAVLYLKHSNQLPAGYEDLSIEQLINTVDDNLIAKALEVLTAQKQYIYGYEVDLGKDDLIKERALVGVAWSGDAMYSIELAAEGDVELDYFVPELGGNIWFDGWVIPKNAQNKAAAKIFIDFLNNPGIAMENMMEIGYTSAVNSNVIESSEQAMDVFYDAYEVDEADEEEAKAEFFGDIRRYPDSTSNKLGVMHDFGNNNEKVVKMWETVRAYGLSVWGIVLIVLGALVLLAVIVFAFFKSKDKKRQKID